MQGDPGVKSANCLCGYVAMFVASYVEELSTSFSILFNSIFSSALHQFKASGLSLPSSVALQIQKNFSHVETILDRVCLKQSNEPTVDLKTRISLWRDKGKN